MVSTKLSSFEGVAISPRMSPTPSGWSISIATLVALIPSSPALGLYSQGYFVGPITAEFGWSRTAFMSAVSVAFVMLALINPLVGLAGDRYGVRRMLLWGVIAYAVANAMLATVNGSLIYYWALTMAAGMLSVFQTPLLFAKAIAGWMKRDRGIALAVGLSGVAVGNIIIPPLTAWLVEAYGWRGGRIGQGLLVLLISFPVVFFFIRDPINGAMTMRGREIQRLTLKHLVCDRTFLLLGTAFALSGMALNGSLVHFVPLITDRGMSIATATTALSIMAIAQLVGRLITGFFLDRVPTPKVGLIWFLLAIAGLALLNVGDSLLWLVPAAIMIGVALGSEVELAAYYSARFFGMARFAQIYGFVTATYGLGSALGGLVLGFSYDRTGNYTAAMIFVIAMLIVSCVAILRLPPYTFSRDAL